MEYLPDEARAVHLEAGEEAPFEGWLLSPSRLAELYELARFRIEGEDEAEDEVSP